MDNPNFKNLINSPYAGKSVDVVAGDYLKNKYATKNPYLTLAHATQTSGGADSPNHAFWWKTSTFAKSGSPIIPSTSPRSVYNIMKQDISCGVVSNSPEDNTKEIQSLLNEVEKIKLIRDNFSKFNSKYLLPPEEVEKMIAQVSSKIESNEAKINQLKNNTPIESSDSYCRDFSLQTSGYKQGQYNGYDVFDKRSNAFFDLMVLAFKSNYTRSISYYCNNWANGKDHRQGGHKKYNNAIIREYLSGLTRTLNNLVLRLKKANIYDEAMIVFACELPLQNNGSNDSATHRTDNMPWLIVNSGKTGEYNDSTTLHPGVIHCNILNRLGMSMSIFSSADHELGRPGNNKIKIL